MKRFIYLLGIGIVSLLSCSKIDQNEVGSESSRCVKKVFYATLGDDTRTSADEFGKVSWTEGDKIWYSYEAGMKPKKAYADASGRTAKFTLEIPEDAAFIVAVHGGDSLICRSGNELYVPCNNNAVYLQSGRFNDSNLAVAKTYDINNPVLHFKNANSLIKLSFERDDVAYVDFISNEGSIGPRYALTLNLSGEELSSAVPLGMLRSIRALIGGSGDYYLMVPQEASLPSGFTIRCYDSNGVVLGVVTSHNRMDINRNSIVNLGCLDSKMEELSRLTYEPNLSIHGTANCYIVPFAGEYYFDAAVMGSSSEPIVGTPWKAVSLWEVFGERLKRTINKGDIIYDVRYENGRIYFKSTGIDGNASIALIDRDESIIWSWHIWCCRGYDAESSGQVYNNDVGIMMDRNIGAFSSTPGREEAVGLVYEWGRKDPFIKYTYGGDETLIGIKSTKYAMSSITCTALSDIIANPTKNARSVTSYGDWLPDNEEEKRWRKVDQEKGLFDPCPPGWRVPEINVWTDNIGMSQFQVDVANINMEGTPGVDFSLTENKLGTGGIWYPLFNDSATPDGSCWSVSDMGTGQSYMMRVYCPVGTYYRIYPVLARRDTRNSVRCWKAE